MMTSITRSIPESHISKCKATFKLKRSDLTEKKPGEFCETPKHDVPFSNGIRWWIRWYPAGRSEVDRGYVSVYLHVNKPVMTTCNFNASGTGPRESTYEFTQAGSGHGWRRYLSHDSLRYLIFIGGKLTITCDVEFTVSMSLDCMSPRVNQLFDNVATDFVLVLGSDQLPVHKFLLSAMSPVFRAMFLHDTAESKSSQVVIIDFDYETVKAAIDFCYGRELKSSSTVTVLDILRFADKYDIKVITDQLGHLPSSNISAETFCPIVRFAYHCSKDALLAECCNFFKDEHDKITKINDFATLPVTLVLHVLRTAFNLDKPFDMLCHAQEKGIAFILNHLEQPFIESVSFDHFCAAVNYAWKFSRDELKKTCAEFFNANSNEIVHLPDFINLPPEYIQGVLKLGYDLNHSTA